MENPTPLSDADYAAWLQAEEERQLTQEYAEQERLSREASRRTYSMGDYRAEQRVRHRLTRGTTDYLSEAEMERLLRTGNNPFEQADYEAERAFTENVEANINAPQVEDQGYTPEEQSLITVLRMTESRVSRDVRDQLKQNSGLSDVSLLSRILESRAEWDRILDIDPVMAESLRNQLNLKIGVADIRFLWETYLQYKAQWAEKFAVSEKLSLGAQAHRTRYLEKNGREVQQKALLEKLDHQPPWNPEVEAARKIQRTVKRYMATPCEQTLDLHPGQVVRLVVTVDKVRHSLCYDVIELYTYLKSSFSLERNWIDPTYRVPLKPKQIALIKSKFRAINGCGENPLYTRLTAYPSEDEQIYVGKSIYDRAARQETGQYMLFRITTLADRLDLPGISRYTYIHPDGFLPQEGMISLPASLMRDYLIETGDSVVLEDCFQLKPLTRIIFRPVTPEWYQLKESDTDYIVQYLTEYIQRRYTLQTGQKIPLQYQDRTYLLQIQALYHGKQFVPAGTCKNIEVNVEFLAEPLPTSPTTAIPTITQ